MVCFFVIIHTGLFFDFALRNVPDVGRHACHICRVACRLTCSLVCRHFLRVSRTFHRYCDVMAISIHRRISEKLNEQC